MAANTFSPIFLFDIPRGRTNHGLIDVCGRLPGVHVEAKDVQVTIFEAILFLVELGKRCRLVGLNSATAFSSIAFASAAVPN